MKGFLIHNTHYNSISRTPPLTTPLLFSLNVRHSYKIRRDLFPILLPTEKTFVWERILLLDVLKFYSPYKLVFNITKMYREKGINYFQFWLMRDLFNCQQRRLPPLLKTLPTISSNYVTRFNDPYYFALFFTMMFIPATWSPLLRWRSYFPQLIHLSHFYLWPFGDFFEIKYV